MNNLEITRNFKEAFNDPSKYLTISEDTIIGMNNIL